jgi:hypothetical protein
MKLPEHVDLLRNLITSAFNKQFSRLGIGPTRKRDIEHIPQVLHARRQRFEEMFHSHLGETGSYESAREKLLDELTFTLFNRIAAVKVMEAASLFPPIITKQPEHGDRSFGHKAWLEVRRDMRGEELEGIREYILYAFNELGDSLPLYSRSYPYALLPDPISLNEIIDAFNAVEKDPQVGGDIWQSDDILGWLYESYNNAKKAEFKDSGEKVEHDKVSLQSQVYTPRWVVQFLVNNSLGKLYLEMYPDSEIKSRYKIANAPETQERDCKPLHEIKLIDPACGSGNFLLYAFDLFYELYLDQIENYGGDYDEENIPHLIIEHNLHGIDLDNRAVQLAQLGLYIKACKRRRKIGSLKFNVVSSDFYLPDYKIVRHIFEEGTTLDKNQKALIAEVWGDLRLAYKFGSLIHLDEKIKARLRELVSKREKAQTQPQMFSDKELGIKSKPFQRELFLEGDIEQEKIFATYFFNNLKTAVEKYAETQGNSFLVSKTLDAVAFLEILNSEYDVATANPPYTDSSDFGIELKIFIEDNYKKPYKFHVNLYAAFIKRCYEFVGDNGLVALVHPPTFMYIKTFEAVRKFIIDKTHINIFVEWGYLGMFNPSARVDSAMYILESNKKDKTKSTFIKLNHLYETKRYKALFDSYEKFLIGDSHDLLFSIPQSILKIIESWPFIYWISDDFREKFGGGGLSGTFKDITVGMQMPGNNDKFFRFFWEINDEKNRVFYSKGGAFNKWYGNNWLTVPANIINNYSPENLRRQKQFGVTSGRQSTKGASFRLKDNNTYVDNGTMNVFVNNIDDVFFLLGILNSKVASYIFGCLNPTVNKQAGDLKRIPYTTPINNIRSAVNSAVKDCIHIKKHLCSYSVIEKDFHESPIIKFNNHDDFRLRVRAFIDYENLLLTQVLVNEAFIDEKIYDFYELSENDRDLVLASENECVGGLPVLADARSAFLVEVKNVPEFLSESIQNFINGLSMKEFADDEREQIESEFSSLYQGNNDLESFCDRHKINPINVWYWFRRSNVIPQQHMRSLAMELLIDLIRDILMEDEDGIIPLVPNAGVKILLQRIEDKFAEKGISMAQLSQFDSLLGRPLVEYLNNYFFSELSDHLNLFQYLPKTPFIWHLSSGPDQGFECYIIIYKWSRDKLMRIRSVYLERRERALINRQTDLSGNDSADAQNEKDKIRRQLKEIESFKQKIDELLAEGYDPFLGDGVGKNIAPLQKKKMIPYEVLNPGQLKKYLSADW